MLHTIQLYEFSFINSAILALTSDIVTFIAVKSIQVISAFNLKRMKKESPDGAAVQKISKTNFALDCCNSPV